MKRPGAAIGGFAADRPGAFSFNRLPRRTSSRIPSANNYAQVPQQTGVLLKQM